MVVVIDGMPLMPPHKFACWLVFRVLSLFNSSKSLSLSLHVNITVTVTEALVLRPLLEI